MIVSPRNLRRTLGNLPWYVAEWQALGFDGRYGITNIWGADIQALELTARQYMAGELPEAEREEYLALLAETYELLPLAASIGLSGPTLPVGHPPVRSPGGSVEGGE
jgi:hypothetical protein